MKYRQACAENLRKESTACDESFNLSHTLAAHTRRHSPQFSETTGKRMKKRSVNEMRVERLKTKFIFRLVDDDAEKFHNRGWNELKLQLVVASLGLMKNVCEAVVEDFLNCS